MTLSSWRVALRIARREAVRTKGRSVLVVAMVGLPVLALTFAAVTVRTAQLPPAEAARRAIGSADLRAMQVSDQPVQQSGPEGWSSQGSPSDAKLDDARAFLRRLPAGSRAVPIRTAYGLRLHTGDGGVALAEHRELPLADAISEGMLRLREGRWPASRDEVVVTPDLRRQLGVEVGDSLRTADKVAASRRVVRVTGVAVDPSELGARTVVSPSGSGLGSDVGGASTAWLVDLPRGVSDLQVMSVLNGEGYAVAPRSWFFDPPEVPGNVIDPAAVGVVVVAVGLAALEIVLLAGAAFAVGARRRRRELAVLSATGADRGDIVRTVLGGGVVLGAVAGIVGVVAGVLVVVAARPRLDRLNGALLGPLDLRPLELAAIVGVGVGTAVLAAVLPARAAARASVVESLTGRRGSVRTPRRVPAIGIAAIAAGSALAFWAAGSGDVPAASMSSGGGPIDPGRPARFNLLLLGAVVAELGFVTCAPAVVGLVGRTAARLPLSLRLALRDAARHRTRSGPAVAAVVAAVAGSVAVSVYLASDVDRQRRSYEPLLARGMVEISELGYDGEALTAADRAAAIAALPVEREVALAQPGRCRFDQPCDYWQVVAPKSADCPPGTDPKVHLRCRPFAFGAGIVVAGPELVEMLEGDGGVARSGMGRGAVVVFDARLVEDGHVAMTRDRYVDAAGKPLPQPDVRQFRLPAVVVDAPEFNHRPSAVVPPAVAETHDIPTRRTSTWLSTTRMPTDREVDRARGAGGSATMDVYVERGFQPRNRLALLALLAASTLVTVGATGIATGLAAADSRPDLATLAAVGAGPRVRRVLAMAQAATVAGLGSAMGVLAGLVPAVAVIAARAEFNLVLPWRELGLTVVGVPLIAALLVGAVSRGRLPLERRLA